MDLFMGVLALFLLEMGLLASARLWAIKAKGPFLIGFGILFPLTAGLLAPSWALHWFIPGRHHDAGRAVRKLLLHCGSGSHAHCGSRADPAVSIGASLGVTFPFNIFVGVPIYFERRNF